MLTVQRTGCIYLTQFWRGSENGRHTDADLYHFIQNVECVRKKGKISRKELSL